MEEETNRIFAIKTTSKQERTVADNIKKAIDSGATDVRVSAIIVPDELKGYVLVETPESLARVEQLAEKVAHARTVVRGETRAWALVALMLVWTWLAHRSRLAEGADVVNWAHLFIAGCIGFVAAYLGGCIERDLPLVASSRDAQYKTPIIV